MSKQKSWIALVLCAAMFAVAHGAATQQIVRSGETMAWPHAYAYYRFVVKDRAATNAGNAEKLAIAEIALYDAAGNHINRGLTEVSAADKAVTNLLAGTYAIYGQHDQWGNNFNQVFDGNAATYRECWAQPYSAEWAWIYFTMRLAAGSNPVASYNVAFAPANNVKSWALQGSDDLERWVTLDERNVAAVAAIAPSGVGWCNGGSPIAIDDESGHFCIERGGTLSVDASSGLRSVHSYGGNVSIASAATLRRDVGAGETACSVGGGLSGAGTFEKTGAGTLVVGGVNSGFGGKVKASGGTLAFSPHHVAPKYTYYRFVVKDRDAVYTKTERLRIGEIALYDADGNRINQGLVDAAAADKATTNLLPGTFAVYGQHDPWGNSFNVAFDDNAATYRECWAQPYNAEWAWIYFTMRLATDKDVAPASYNISFSNTNNVRSWALQGSDDHATWFTLDERDNDAVAAIAPSGTGWCNGGTPLSLVHEGDNAPCGEVDAKFFRFTVRAVGEGTDGTRAISELSLYDLQGKRLNLGLASMGRGAAATSLTAGSFTWLYRWPGTYNGDDSHEDKMFDENLSTRLSGWNWDHSNVETPASWMIWTMRLADDAAPVASYNFAPYGAPGGTSCPVDWLMEASRDGSTWFEVDSRSGAAATALLPAAARKYCNNGYPIGFSTGCDRWLAPTGAVVEVSNGATLALPASGSNTIAGLVVDLTAGGSLGTISNFHPAVSGTLHLASATSKPTLDDAALPVALEGIEDGANVEGWSVVLNGIPAAANEYRLRIDENGVFRVTRLRKGLIISFK